MAFGNFLIQSKSDLIEVINEYGFLPFFENSIEGFSIEEHITPDCWWHSDTGEWGAWEWKGPVILSGHVAYSFTVILSENAAGVGVEGSPSS